MQQASLGYIKIHLTSDIPGLMIDQYHPEAAWSLQLFPHVFSPPGASFWIQVAAFRHFIQQFDLLHRKNPGCAVFSVFFWGGCPSDFLPHYLSPPSQRPTPLILFQHLWQQFLTISPIQTFGIVFCIIFPNCIFSWREISSKSLFFLSWSSSNHLKSGKGAEDLLLFSESA